MTTLFGIVLVFLGLCMSGLAFASWQMVGQDWHSVLLRDMRNVGIVVASIVSFAAVSLLALGGAMFFGGVR